MSSGSMHSRQATRPPIAAPGRHAESEKDSQQLAFPMTYSNRNLQFLQSAEGQPEIWFRQFIAAQQLTPFATGIRKSATAKRKVPDRFLANRPNPPSINRLAEVATRPRSLILILESAKTPPGASFRSNLLATSNIRGNLVTGAD